MKRALLLLAATAGLILVAVAVPALSLDGYQPEPVDFEVAAAPDAHLGSRSSGGVVSKPLRAPKRFNLVGFRWEGGGPEPGIAVRTRAAGEPWSRWTPLPAHADHAPDRGRGEPQPRGASDPVWAGQADFVQYRLSRRLRGLRLHFVNATGTATRAERAKTAIRRVANAGVVALGSLATAEAASRPSIVPRSKWGASSCRPRESPAHGRVKVAFVHHTVTANSYTRSEAPSIVLGICRYHRNSNGWNDIGYNFLVDKYGTIYEGRAGGVEEPIVGAQAQGYNAQSTGIANIGDHRSRRQTSAGLRAMARLIRWKLPLHGARTSGSTVLVSAGGSLNRYRAGARVRFKRIAGHRNADSTSCPGDALYDQLPSLRRLVGSVGGGAATVVRAKVRPEIVRYGRRARISGRLRRASDGQPLGGRPIQIQRRTAAGWRTVAETSTAADGRFARRVRPRRTRRLRARFGGSSTYAADASRSFVLAVRPRVTLADPPDRAVKGQRVRLRGSVKPAKRRLLLVVQRWSDGRFRRVAVREVTVEEGRFRTSLRPGRTGVYRFYVVSPRDRKTARGRSPLYRLRVIRGGGGATA